MEPRRQRPLRSWKLLPGTLLSLIFTLAADEPEKPWFERALVGLEVGPTGAERGPERGQKYAERFDGHQIVKESVRTGADYIVIWARDGEYAYYDSKIQPKPPGLGERDVLRETIEEAKKHDLPVIAYCVLQYAQRAMLENPEFRMVGADGQPIQRVCFNSKYAEHVEGLIAELLGYEIQGLHLDMVDQGFGPPHGCWCPNCKKLFEAKYGKPLLGGVTWDEGWDCMLEFRYDTSASFEKRLTAFSRERASGVTVDFNYHGNPPFSFEVGQRPVQHGVQGDFITGETGIWGFSALGVGLNARLYAAVTPDRPVQVVMQRGVRMYHDQTTRPLPDLRWELLTLLAHGSFVTIVDKTAYDGWLDPVAYDRFRDAFRDAKARRAHFGQPVVEEVGIYFSHRTRDWYGRSEASRYFRSFQGAHLAMAYEHLPWGIIPDESVSAEKLAKFPLVLVPGAAILSDREIELLDGYVRRGGRLVLTGHTGQLDRFGQPHPPEALEKLEKLVGARLERRLETFDNHVRLGKHRETLPGLSREIREDWPFLVKGPAAIWKPTNGKPVGELLRPHRSELQKEGRIGTDWPLSADAPVGPAAILHELGSGQVLTLATSPGYASTSEHRIAEARFLLRNAVESIRPPGLVRIEAPRTVESIVTHDPDSRTLRVHLLGYQAPPATTPPKNRPYVLPTLIEDIPIFRVKLEVNREVEAVSTFEKSTKLEHSGREIRVLVESIHDVVVIRYR